MSLTREAILAAQDSKTVEVEVPEWGGSVYVRTLTGAERDAFGATLVTADGKPDMAQYREKLLVRCVVDENGAQLFTPADVEALSGKAAIALKRLEDVADKLNTVGPTQVDAAEKN